MVKCVTSATAEALLEFSENSDDDSMKAQFPGLSAFAVISEEFHYHRSCQRNLTSKIMTTTINDDVVKINQYFEDITNYDQEQ